MAHLISSFKYRTASHKEAMAKMLALLELSMPGIQEYIVNNKGPLMVLSMAFADFEAMVDAQKSPFPELDYFGWALDIPDNEAMSVTNLVALHAAAALVWMSYAKPASDSSRNAYAIARPRALAGRFLLSVEDTILFPEKSHGPSLDSLSLIHLGANMYEGIRYLITAFMLASFTQMGFSPASYQPYGMLFKMLENTGMTHVGIILTAVEMHPWLLGVPELAPNFTTFGRDLDHMDKVPRDQRPYHRLLYPQNMHLFNSAQLKQLTAVCYSFVSDIDDSYKNYVADTEPHEQLVSLVRARQPSNFSIPNIDLLAAKFGVSVVHPREAQAPQLTGQLRAVV